MGRRQVRGNEDVVLTNYLRTITASYRRFTQAEEQELADRKDWGDIEARDLLVAACLPMVVARARRYAIGNGNFYDFIQHGNLFLLKGIKVFNPRGHNGARLSTHAWWWISAGIRECAISSNSCGSFSLDIVAGEGDVTWANKVPDLRALYIEEVKYYKVCCSYVEELLQQLPPREAYILRRKFTTGPSSSYRAIGKALLPPLSKTRIGQIVRERKKQLLGYHRRCREKYKLDPWAACVLPQEVFVPPQLLVDEDFRGLLNNVVLDEPDPPWPVPPEMTKEEMLCYLQRKRRV